MKDELRPSLFYFTFLFLPFLPAEWAQTTQLSLLHIGIFTSLSVILQLWNVFNITFECISLGFYHDSINWSPSVCNLIVKPAVLWTYLAWVKEKQEVEERNKKSCLRFVCPIWLGQMRKLNFLVLFNGQNGPFSGKLKPRGTGNDFSLNCSKMGFCFVFRGAEDKWMQCLQDFYV